MWLFGAQNMDDETLSEELKDNRAMYAVSKQPTVVYQ